MTALRCLGGGRIHGGVSRQISSVSVSIFFE
jgi:hypothetical protein